jgi:membrane-bound lytic murein transglycosylase MltF
MFAIYYVMKKIIHTCLLTAVAFLLTALASCDSQSPTDDTPGLAHPLDRHLTKTYREDLPGLLKRKYIRVLAPVNRTNYYFSGPEAFGFEYALLKEYEKHLNKSNGRGELDVTVDFIPVARDHLLSGLIEGRGDIAAAGLTITKEREELVSFTDPYLEGVCEVLVSHRDEQKLESLDDLSGREVFVRESSSYFESLEMLNKSFKKEGMDPVEIILADETLETEDILEMVNAGAFPHTIADDHIARIWAGMLPDIVIQDKVALRKNARIAWVLRKGSPKLQKSLNTFLKNYKKGTLLGNVYFNRYFKGTTWITRPRLTDENKKLARVFRKYGEMYGFDWALLMAQGYQESGLDQGRKSPAGAEGIMQIKPSTAADQNVGINDISTVDRNIQAATKYMAFLRDRYFSDEGIKERDRVRFTLAAYNAGPASIRRMRARTEKMGLDQNKWFRNVEIAALRHISREPVRYVSNINKYYIQLRYAFSALKEREAEKDKLVD